MVEREKYGVDTLHLHIFFSFQYVQIFIDLLS